MNYFFRARSRYRYRVFLGIIIVIGLSVPLLARAVESPPEGTLTYMQTNGPLGNIGLGDWYTNPKNGVGAGSHYVSIDIPCGWPATQSIDIDLRSPAINTNRAILGTYDESDNGATSSDVYSTTFELYAPSISISPTLDQPAPGASDSLVTRHYAPVDSAPPEPWVRFATIPAPVSCGSYILRAEARDDDQNGWRLRIGDDDDADPNNTLPANYDNPDGVSGSGDELTIGLYQISYQHEQKSDINSITTCLTLYEYVEPNQTEVVFHNFDLDENLEPPGRNYTRVRYYAPSQLLDPVANSGGIVGTPSFNAAWNNGTQTMRGGDRIANPEAGWWRIVTCASRHNQYIQEAQTNVQAYYEQPPTPSMALSKTNGQSVVVNNQTMTYTLTFTNTSHLNPPAGAATRVRLIDDLPGDVVFQRCRINAPLTGTCSHNGTNPGGSVSFTISDTIRPAQSGSVAVTVQVNNSILNPPLVNLATLTFEDALNHSFAPIVASDSDQIAPTAVALAGFSVQQQANTLRLKWLTGAETQSLGFHVYRGTTPERTQAGRVSADLIPARGPGSSYSWTDTDVAPATRYYYWLAELDTAGATNEYGPASGIIVATATWQVFLPLMQR